MRLQQNGQTASATTSASDRTTRCHAARGCLRRQSSQKNTEGTNKNSTGPPAHSCKGDPPHGSDSQSVSRSQTKTVPAMASAEYVRICLHLTLIASWISSLPE